jgi:putative peptidoglycan lipid II flippase
LFLVGEQALSFIYERGQFTAEDTHNTYIALIFYLPMIVTQGLQYIVSKSMYARGKTAIIFRISVTTIALNAFLNWLLLKPFGYPGLALSSAFVSVYYLIASGFVVYKDFDRSEAFKLLNLVVRVIIPTLIMAVPLYLLQKFTPITELYSLTQLIILIPLGVILYVAGIYIFYREGFNQLLSVLRKKKKARA